MEFKRFRALLIVAFDIIFGQFVSDRPGGDIQRLGRPRFISGEFFQRLQDQVFFTLGQGHPNRNAAGFVGQFAKGQFRRKIIGI